LERKKGVRDQIIPISVNGVAEGRIKPLVGKKGSDSFIKMRGVQRKDHKQLIRPVRGGGNLRKGQHQWRRRATKSWGRNDGGRKDGPGRRMVEKREKWQGNPCCKGMKERGQRGIVPP